MTLEKTVEQVEDLIADGEQAEAGKVLGAAFTEFGETEELLVLQAELSLDEEDYDGVVGLTKQAESKVTDIEWLARLWTARGYAHFYEDQREEARVAFNTAISKDPELLNAFTGRAMVHEEMGFLNAALLDLDRIVDQDDQDGQPFAIRASIHMRMGNVEIAEADLDHAVRMDPDDDEARLQLARIYALLQKTAPAMEVLEKLVERCDDPDYMGPAAILRSQLSLTMNAHDAALEDADRVINAIPDEPWGYLQKAATLISQAADGGAAIDMLKQAESKVDSARDLPDLYALRAAAYEVLSKPEKAQEIRDDAEGVARLPSYVYGPLNPVEDIPINPRKPMDIRALLDDLFGDAASAPEGYENVLREIAAKIPDIVKEHPNVGKLHIDLPEAEGMIGGKRQLVINVGNKNPQNQA